MNKYSYDEVYNSLLEVMSSKPKEYRVCRLCFMEVATK